MTIVVRAVFPENNECYPQFFLDECLYKIQMKSNSELKEIDIKNCKCYYFNDIINGTKIVLSNILLNKKLYENISVYNISYKTPTGPKPLRIRFDKKDGFIIALEGKVKHLVLFNYGLFNKICDKIKYLISKKSGITNVLIIILERSEFI